MTKRNPTKLPRPTGRPPVHGPDVPDRICALLAQGEPLSHICALPGMPRITTVLAWASPGPDLRPGFPEKYARAREALATKLVAEAIALVDEPSADSVQAQDKRTRADMRKWLASKLFPRQYGDRVQSDVQTLDAEGRPTDPARPVFTVVIEG